MQNVDLVKKLYAAFAKGDIDTLIDHLTTESLFRFDGPAVIPYAGEHRTPQGIRDGFFGPLAKSLSDEMLSPEEFVAQDDKVVMIGRYKATISATGKTVDQAVVHIFTIKDGKVSRFLSFTDPPESLKPTPLEVIDRWAPNHQIILVLRRRPSFSIFCESGGANRSHPEQIEDEGRRWGSANQRRC